MRVFVLHANPVATSFGAGLLTQVVVTNRPLKKSGGKALEFDFAA